MEENNINMSDEELHELLKSRLLSDDDGALTGKLTDMQAKILFSAPAAIAPPPAKEKELLAQAGQKAAFKLSFGWVFTSLSAAAAITITSVFLLKSTPQNTPQIPRPLNDQAPALYKAAPVQAEAAYTKADDKDNYQIKSRNSDSVATAATTLEPVTTMESAAPAASTQTVLPIGSATVLAVSETRTATPSVSDIKCAAAQPATSALKPAENQNTCRIWKTQDICSTPNNLKYPYLIECDLCEYNVDCKELGKKGATAVIFRIYKKSGFTLDKGFSSIALIKPDGRRFEPLAISIDRYMSSVKKLRVKFTKVIDMVMLFPEAAPGDRVIIDGAGEAIIEGEGETTIK